jgi:hypothetical protein
MLLVLDLDPAALGEVAFAELRSNDCPGRPHRLEPGRKRVAAMLADDVRRLEAVAAHVEIISGQSTT